jgi:hypothetical protein
VTVHAARVLAVCLGVASVGCDNAEPTPDWSRMITQPRLSSFGATELFADQRAMRPLPAGTVPRESIADPVRRTGLAASGEVSDVIPLPITRALLDRGRERFAIVCAPCHGIAGDGDSVVARSMQRRRPPSLYEPRIAALAPGALYRVITLGYGLMPSYAALLGPDDRQSRASGGGDPDGSAGGAGVLPRGIDRWAVVAYVRTLELAWTAKLDALPPAIRDDVARRLP